MSPGKWCHFKQRLQRPLSLKSAKSHATLDWEDEPFSFVAFARKGAGQQEQEQVQKQDQRRVPDRPLLEGQDVCEGEKWGWGRVLWPTIHVCCCRCCICRQRQLSPLLYLMCIPFQRKGHVIMDVCESDGSLQVPLSQNFFAYF